MPKPDITLTPFYKGLIEIWIEFKTCLCTKHADNFCNIRQQIIWGNMRIKHKGKSLLFRNWIQYGIIFIKNILSENGLISEHVIFNKLHNKRNWIAEFNIWKNSLPKTWIQIPSFISRTNKCTNTLQKENLIYHTYINTGAVFLIDRYAWNMYSFSFIKHC